MGSRRVQKCIALSSPSVHIDVPMAGPLFLGVLAVSVPLKTVRIFHGSDSGTAGWLQDVRIEDFDDEEEYLLAGGDVEQAKKKKEWGLHDFEKEEDETVEDDVAAGAKLKKEELRAMYKESERLLRERRCMIKPAVIERRTVTDLFAKVQQRVSMLAAAPVAQLDPVPAQPSVASPEKSGADAAGPARMSDDDESDEDDLVFIRPGDASAEQPAVIEELVPAAPSTPAPVKAETGKGTALATTAVAQQGARFPLLSPPSGRKKRHQLFSKLRDVACQRSEHLKRENLPAQGGLRALAGDVALEPAPEPFAGNTAAFIPSERFEGSKKDYIFVMRSAGLGYYKDSGPNMNTDNIPTNVGQTSLREPFETQMELALEDSDDDAVGHGAPSEGVSAARTLRLDDDQDTLVDSLPGAADSQTETTKGSIFAAFQGSDPLMAPDGGPAQRPTATTAESAPENAAGDLAPSATQAETAVPAPRRVYGRKLVESSPQKTVRIPLLFGASAGLVTKPKTVEESKPIWRAPVLDESSDDEDNADDEGEDGDLEASDDGGEAVEDSEEGSDEDSEEDSEEEDDGPKEPVKKSLNDVLSIKKQANLRMGTLESGYLRTEQEMLGYHDDLGVAKEDLEEGIDLMETDGEDAEEEIEDSDAEREVAEGFIEDAKFAVTDLDPTVNRGFHMQQEEEDEQKITDRIMDVVRGEARRRKAAGQDESWIPNRNARQRLMNQGEEDAAFDIMNKLSGVGDDEEAQADLAAQLAAQYARDSISRRKFAAEQAALKLAQNQPDDDEDAAPAAPPAPIRRSVTGPSLSAFTRQLSTVGRSTTVVSGSGAGAKGAVPLKRSMSGSLARGSMLGTASEAPPAQALTKVASSKNFFFETRKTATEDTPDNVAVDARTPNTVRSHCSPNAFLRLPCWPEPDQASSQASKLVRQCLTLVEPTGSAKAKWTRRGFCCRWQRA